MGTGSSILNDYADVTYKCTRPYRPEHDRVVRWNDPDIGVDWPVAEGTIPCLSEKDANAPLLVDVEGFV